LGIQRAPYLDSTVVVKLNNRAWRDV